MTQSRLGSLLESLTNILIGFGISALANFFLLPLWGLQVSASASLEIGLVFTLLSLLRSYILRRCFNSFTKPGRGIARLHK